MTLPRTLLLALFLLACQNRSTPAPSPSPAPAPSAAPVAKPAPAPSAAPAGAANAGGLRSDPAPPFESRAPKSRMRAAEYAVTGDDRAELTVFYFGPDQGGSIDANVSRWLGQITQPDGSDSGSKAKRDTRKVGNLEVALLEVAGNYSGGMAMPGAPAPAPIEDAMMLAAIASGPEGPVFFKLVGPRDTVERSRSGFEQMIGSLHPMR